MVHWRTVTIGELTELVTKGTTPTSVGFRFTDTGVNFVKIESVTKNGFFLPNKFAHIGDDCHESLKRSQLKNGDILFSIAGALGRTAQVTPEILPANTNQALAIIRLHPSPEIMPEFVMRALSSGMLIEQIEKQRGGVAQQNLSLAQVKNFQIPLPPLPEQKRIVAILDEAFAGIDAAVANTEKNLANARELFESYLNGVFTRKGDGWVEKKFDSISDVKGGKRVPKGYKLQSEPTKHPYIAVANFNDKGSVDLDGLRYVSEEVHAEIKRYTISPKNLYISIAGTIGKTGIIPDELDGANLTENACKLVFYEGVLNKFVYFFTRTASFVNQALLNTRVAAQPKLALSRLATIKLLVPSIKEQQKVIADCEALWAESQRLETIYQQKLTALAKLKQSILQKAFAGEL